MKRVLLAFVACLAVSACATTEKAMSRAGTSICANADAIRLAALMTIQNAGFISDPVVRNSLVGSAQAMLTALDACPKEVPVDA